jgi:tRNA-dihydrouridine synthase 1
MAELSGNWYRRLGSPRHVLAPMVDQSEHAFRVLCKRHGTDLCYTPMFSARQFAASEQYRKEIFGPTEGSAASEDRPLVVQFAGNDPQVC